MGVSAAKRRKELEADNTSRKNLLAEQVFENDVIKDVLQEWAQTDLAKRELLR